MQVDPAGSQRRSRRGRVTPWFRGSRYGGRATLGRSTRVLIGWAAATAVSGPMLVQPEFRGRGERGSPSTAAISPDPAERSVRAGPAPPPPAVPLPYRDRRSAQVAETGSTWVRSAVANLLFALQHRPDDPTARRRDTPHHRAIQLARYPHVVGSQWPVPDRAAHWLAADFYASLTGGTTTRPPTPSWPPTPTPASEGQSHRSCAGRRRAASGCRYTTTSTGHARRGPA